MQTKTAGGTRQLRTLWWTSVGKSRVFTVASDARCVGATMAPGPRREHACTCMYNDYKSSHVRSGEGYLLIYHTCYPVGCDSDTDLAQVRKEPSIAGAVAVHREAMKEA